jgi:hypothetical protein
LYSLHNWLSKFQKEVELLPGDRKQLDFEFLGNSIIRGQCRVEGKEAEGIELKLRQPDQGDPFLTAITEEEGLYQLQPVPEGEFVLTASSGMDGIGGALSKKIHVGDKEQLVFNFDFEGISLKGIIKNENGQSIYGCWLTLSGKEDQGSFNGYTDLKGQYAFYSLPQGLYELSIAAPGHAQMTDEIVLTSSSSSEKNYTLKSEGILRLKVKDSYGKEISETKAILVDPPASQGETLSNGKGLFIFKNLLEGKVSVLAGGEGLGPAMLTVGILAGETVEKTILLSNGGSLIVEARDSEAQPLAGASISLGMPGLWGISWSHLINQGFIQAESFPFITKENGQFQIGSLPPGTYTIIVKHGASKWSGETKVEPGKKEKIKATL